MSDEKTRGEQKTTFDIESEYQQQIAPIEKKLTRLKKSFETKSLRLHKGFLTKEKKAQAKLQKIDNDASKAKAKIDSATSSKLTQLNKIDQSLKKSLKSKVDELKTQAKDDISIYKEEIDAIRDDLHEELGGLHEEYLKNVHVYQEKLASYEKLSADKHSLYTKTYEDHIASLSKEFNAVSQFTSTLQKDLLKTKKSFIKDIQKYVTTTEKDHKAAINEAEKTNQATSKKTDEYTKKVERFIDAIKASYVDHYQPMLKSIKEQEILLKDTYQNTLARLKDDLTFRTAEKDTMIEHASKTHEKNEKRRLALFEERYELYKEVEDTLKDRKLALLTFEQTSLRQILDREMTNLDKLEAFLKNDFDEINNYSGQIRSLEHNVYNQVQEIHEKLHSHLEHSTSQMIDFVDQFNQKMMKFEQNLITLIKNHLNQLHQKNQEIDRLDREIDLSEPQKEIALNDFEENLALQDIKNRYQIKILNKEHEIHLINLKLDHDINILTLEHTKKRLANDFDITSAKIKGDTKLHLEDAKKKCVRAKEVYHLRENSLKHDEKQALLSLETKAKKLEIKKERAPIDAEKNQLLLRKEVSQSIYQLSQKRDLETHMVEQKYQEQIKKIDQEIAQIHQEKESLEQTYIKRQAKLVDAFTEQTKAVKQSHQKQLDKLQEAFVRECKIPKSNMEKWQSFQNTKLENLAQLLIHFEKDFREEEQNYASMDDVSLVKETFDSEVFTTFTTNTIFGYYDVYLDTVNTLFTITKESLEDQASLSIDTSTQRKLARDLERKIKDFEKQIANIKKARDQQVKSYVLFLTDAFRKIMHQKFQSTTSFIEAFDHIYEETKTSLEQLQHELGKEIKELFIPITQHDKATIKSAEESHSQAESELQEKLQNSLRPLEITHEQALKELAKEKQDKMDDLDDSISEKEDKKAYLHQIEEQEVAALEKEYQEKILPFDDQLTSLDEAREKGEIKTIEQLNADLQAIKEEEQHIIKTYEEKIDEAKRILDYEEKIEQTTIENLKAKEQEQLDRKQSLIDEEINAIKEEIDASDQNLAKAIEELKEELYQETSSLSHEIYLSNPEVQKQMQELRNQYEDQESIHREELLENKKEVRQIIDSFDQQIRIEYNQFYDQLNQQIERMKQTYSKKIHSEISIFTSIHEDLFKILETSYQEGLKSMKSHTLTLTQKLNRLNKNLS